MSPGNNNAEKRVRSAKKVTQGKVSLGAMFFLSVIALSLTGCDLIFPRTKWGFIDKTGKVVIPCQFDDVATDNYGGFEDPNMTHFIPKPFRNFSEGLCPVRIGDKWGYIDKTGAVVIAPQYDSAGIFSEGVACVRKGMKVGYIDISGKFVVPMELNWFPYSRDEGTPNPELDFGKMMIQNLAFSDGLAVSWSGTACGYVDKTGKFVIPAKWERCSSFQNGKTIVVGHGTTSCLIDKAGKVTKLPDSACYFSEDVLLEGFRTPDDYNHPKYVYADIAGKRLFPQVFTSAGPFSEGLASVAPYPVTEKNQNHGWGYIDKTGKMVIKPDFNISGNNTASNFIDGRAIVTRLNEEPLGTRNLHGIIDKSGNWILSPKYSHISAYREGLARAFTDNGAVFLDPNGKEVIQTHTGWANSFSDGMAAVSQRR